MPDASPLPTTRAAAKAAGAVRFFSGTVCKHGHVAERYASSGRCVVCSGDAWRRIYDGSPEGRLIRREKYLAAMAKPGAREAQTARINAWRARKRAEREVSP